MATLVYTGAGNGTLFAGKKFFLLQRVPQRSWYQDNIIANGGEISKTEKQADIIIGDHLRRDQPPNTISWKWIEDSMKNGQLEELEAYRVEHKDGSGNGGSKSTKRTTSGRTPFTAQDDLILEKWVRKAERQGKYLMGNAIYKELEAKCSRHTWQSWRNRWVNQLSNRPRPKLPEEDEEEDEEDENDERDQHVEISLKRKERVASGSRPRNATPSSRKLPFSSPEVLNKQAAGNTIFTSDETELLENGYEHIVNVDEDKELDAWFEFANEYSTHTAQEWRNYFHEYIKPRQEAKYKKTGKKLAKHDEAESFKMASKNDQAQSDHEVQGRSSSLRQEEMVTVKNSTKTNRDPTLDDKELFENELAVFLAKFLPEEEWSFSVILGDKEIPLFEIWQVVKSEPFGNFDAVENNDKWPHVAKRLGLKNSQIPETVEDLAACYERLLIDFEEFRERFKTEYDWYQDDTQDDAMIQNQLLSAAGSDARIQDNAEVHSLQDGSDMDASDEDLDGPSSVLPLHPGSRKRQDLHHYSQPTPEPSSKRQRVDKGKGIELEIPSTPEEVFRKPATHPDVSPTKPKAKQSTKLPILEPETQDFQFQEEDENPLSPASSSIEEITPSQAIAHEDVQDDSSTQSQTESQEQAPLEQFMEESMAFYDEKEVVDSLFYTTGEITNARYVMEQLHNSQKVPDDLPGVWTREDDAALLNREERGAYRAMIKKHGNKRAKARMKFLGGFST